MIPARPLAGLLGCAPIAWALRHGTAQAVRRWRPGAGRSVRSGPLQVRHHGTGERVVLLLHGMLASGRYFGAAYDRLAGDATLVVPDLLGFGGSRAGVAAGSAEQLDALDAMLDGLSLGSRRVIVAGHSMGGALGLRWAARHHDRVDAVVAFGAPLYLDPAEADARIAGMGRVEAFLTGDGPLPRAVCDWMCAHHRSAAALAVAGRPSLPVPVARDSVKHTWRSYFSAYTDIVRSSDWQPKVEQLARQRVPVTLAAGAFDPVPVPGRAAELARCHPGLHALAHREGDHGLPLTHPAWCAALVNSLIR